MKTFLACFLVFMTNLAGLSAQPSVSDSALSITASITGSQMRGAPASLASVTDGWIVRDKPREKVEALFLVGLYLAVFLILWAFAKPEIRGHRFVALLLVLLDAWLAVRLTGDYSWVALLLIPLGLIWFAEMLGAFKGNVGGGGIINTETPEWMVAGFGWLLLLLASGFLMLGSLPRKPAPPILVERSSEAPPVPAMVRQQFDTPLPAAATPRYVSPLELPSHR